VSPEAQVAGPIAAIRDGDVITIDLAQKSLSVSLDEEELARRLVGFEPRDTGYERGALAKFALLAQSASKGAVTS
jgi:dihydroxy-acid dehydratase